MVNNRNARRKNESTFLEQVLRSLETLQHEVATIRTLLEPDMLKPPVPPPMLDTYNRSFLLQQKMLYAEGWLGSGLPKCQPIVTTGQASDIDGRSYEVDEITAFLEKEGQYGLPNDVEAKMTAIDEKEAPHAGIIWSAQKEAYKQRLKENRAIRTIQRFGKACLSKLSVAPSRRGFTSAKACGPHPGRHINDEVLQKYRILEASDVADLSENEQSELTAEPRSTTFGHARPLSSGSSTPTMEEVIEKNNQKDYELQAKFVCQDCAMLYDRHYRRCSCCSGRIQEWKGSSSYRNHMRLFHAESDSETSSDKESIKEPGNRAGDC